MPQKKNVVTRPQERPIDLSCRLGLTQKELALVTGKSASYWRRLARRGLGPKAIRVGGRGLIFVLDGPGSVREWLARNAEDPADAVTK